ncbi:hypothetical protein L7F22_037805 [Adiantum nelumboides]|nr:hypothetical protein [Adiantum nelumboides]
MSSPPSSQRSKCPIVCIVGAGMTGICACKYLLQHGIQPVVVEAQPGIGGVWRHNFASTKLQTPRDGFQFSDYTWPSGTPDYASHIDVKEYLHSCASFMSWIASDLTAKLFKLDNSKGFRWALCIQNSLQDKHTNVEGDLEASFLFPVVDTYTYIDTYSSMLTICFVASGMTGICACKYLLQHGMQPVVLEAQPGIDGVWRHNFASTKLQTPRDGFQFSDYTWPSGTPDYPSHIDVKEYLHSYACKFHVMDCIRFNRKVVQIRQLRDPLHELHSSAIDDTKCAPKGFRWALCVQNSSQENRTSVEGDLEWLFCDFLVLCIGRYGDIPKLPTYPPSKGPEIFQGKVLHSMEYAKLDDGAARDLLQDKRVVVIGMMKSALHVAMKASNANQGINGHSCSVIYRTARWMLPHHAPFRVPLYYLYLTRLSELMTPKPDQGFILSIISTLLGPAEWEIVLCDGRSQSLWRCIFFFLRELGLVPKQIFFEQLASCQVPLLPDAFFQRVKGGQINLHKAESWSFSKSGVVLGDGTNIEGDVVILGTGYDGEKKLKCLLQPVCGEVQNFGSALPLYRGVIHPRIPHLAVLGFHENISNLHAAEMGAQWLAHLLSRKISLPSIDTMEKVTQKWIDYMRNSTSFHQKPCINAVSIWHADQVCEDLGWNPKRKKNFFKSYWLLIVTWITKISIISLLKKNKRKVPIIIGSVVLAPYSNMDYKD